MQITIFSYTLNVGQLALTWTTDNEIKNGNRGDAIYALTTSKERKRFRKFYDNFEDISAMYIRQFFLFIKMCIRLFHVSVRIDSAKRVHVSL